MNIPESIDEQTIVKLIKIYETNQKYYFEMDDLMINLNHYYSKNY